MSWLNYHHLFYFWNVAREGSIARAARQLRLTEPTISTQIHALEEALAEKLFERQGRSLALTEIGWVAYRYASDIFALGHELQAAVAGAATSRTTRFRVGVVDMVPSSIAFRLLEPALLGVEPVELVCHRDSRESLSTRLEAHEVDVVISDAPLVSGSRLKTQNRLLGECGISIFGTQPLATRCAANFPKSLDKAPFLLPAEGTALRRSLDDYFEATGISPWVRGEFVDSALLKTFGGAGVGVFAAPTAIARELKQQYRVRVIGHLKSIRERYFVTSIRRKVEHPVVQTLSHVALKRAFH